jgi:hypothetical protein
MLKLENLTLAALILFGAAVPLAALGGYYAPSCDWHTVWTLGSYQHQYVCF